MTTTHRLGSLGAWRSLQLLIAGAAVSIGARWYAPAAYAEVLVAGNVTPAPPAEGGAFDSPLLVGDSMIGTLAINGGSMLKLTDAASLSIADKFNSIGAVSMSGMGSYLEAEGTMLIGNRGAATFEVRSQASFQAKNGLQLGVNSTADGTLIVENLGSIISIQSPAIIGAAGIGAVQLLGGGRTAASSLTVGRLVGSQGLLTIEGVSSQWQQAGSLVVGESGDGVIEINEHGQLVTGTSTLGVNATSSGRVSVSGVGSRWNISGASASLTIGGGGYGEVSIDGGGRTSVAGPGYIGMVSGARGSVEVDGAGSHLSLAGLTLGNAGEGVLRIRQGGRVTTTAGLTIGIAPNGRGEALVDGAGSVLEATSQTKTTIGNGQVGRALLTVSDGGLVRAITGMSIGGLGELAVNGGRVTLGESALDNQGLIRGAGRIDGAISNAISGRIRARSDETLIVSKTLTNDGQVEIDGGELEIVGALTNLGVMTLREGVLRGGTNGIANNSPGQMAVIGGVVDVFGAVTNNLGGQMLVGGGATAVFHERVQNNGQFLVMPGAEAIVLDNLNFGRGSTLALELGAAESIGKFEVGGIASVSGALSVELQAGYTPRVGDAFQIITAAKGIVGNFATTSLPSLASGLAWDVDASSNSYVLSVVATVGLSADFDSDGLVNGSDLAAWKTGFGKTSNVVHGDGDANGDGVVDGADFMAWQRQFVTAPSTPVTAAAPEPSTAMLLAAGLLLGSLTGRRSRI